MSSELTREYISELRAIIEVRDDKAALNKLEMLHPADLAEIYEILSLEESTYLYLLLEPERLQMSWWNWKKMIARSFSNPFRQK